MHEHFIRRCYALVDVAIARGDMPFAALLAIDDRIVAEACNAVSTRHDPTRHAETVLLADVLPRLGDHERARAVLYASTEPCMMCAAATYWSGIGTVVYGCSAESLAAEAGPDFLVPCREVFARGARPVEVIGPILDAVGRAQHQSYWRARS
jgi:tRNA(Arg) A34 adenosine deaminase TadA